MNAAAKPRARQREAARGGPATVDRFVRKSLTKRFRAVQQAFGEALKNGRKDDRAVHQLRVSTRRATAALGLFKPCLRRSPRKKAAKLLRALRAAAREPRRLTVHSTLLHEYAIAASGDLRAALQLLLNDVRSQRQAAGERLTRSLRHIGVERTKRVVRRAIDGVTEPSAAPSLDDLVRSALSKRAAKLLIASNQDLASVDHAHEFRLATKRLRYLLEIAHESQTANCLELQHLLEQLQHELGDINDLAELAESLEQTALSRIQAQCKPKPSRLAIEPVAHDLQPLLSIVRDQAQARHDDFLKRWNAELGQEVRARLRGLCLVEPGLEAAASHNGAAHAPDALPRPEADQAPDFTAADGATRRVAAIDVGTNSIRLVIAEVGPDRRVRILDDEKAVTRLGRGLARSGKLSARATNESVLALTQFRAIAEGYRVERLRAVATCAVREARNGREFVAQVRREAGLDLQVIPPHAEARLAFRSVSDAFDLQQVRSAVIDIGGGSTEIVLGSGGHIEQVFSLPVGAIRLTEAYGIGDDIAPDNYERLRRDLRRLLKSAVGKPLFIPHIAIGTGGTFTALAAMSMQRGAGPRSEYLPFNVRGYEMQRSELKHILDQLRGLSLAGRQQVPGLSAERADIIVAGLTIIDLVLKHLQVNTLRVHDQGVRAGLLHSMVDELFPHQPGAPPAPNRIAAVRQFATSCNFEQEHSEHVARLALSLFDELSRELGRGGASPAWASAENRELLYAAALLHDIGYFINYSRHHKHSYHLVMHSDLPGFTHRQREVIANIGRYHRGANPKKAHVNFARLSGKDRELVRTLSAILRVADGLDRSHSSNTRTLEVHVHEGVAFVRLSVHRDATVDIWGAARKSGLFEKVFGLKIRFSCGNPELAPEAGPPPAERAVSRPPRQRQPRQHAAAPPDESRQPAAPQETPRA